VKFLINLSLALLIFSVFAFTIPTSVFATTVNTNIQTSSSTGNNFISNFINNWNGDNHNNDDDNDDDDDDDNDDKFCRKHPEHRKCRVDVPEFGMIPGVIAALTSGGTYLFLKKRASKS